MIRIILIEALIAVAFNLRLVITPGITSTIF